MDQTPENLLGVLLVDDDADDRMIFEDAISEIDLNVSLNTIKDGVELMKYLLQPNSQTPDILFLDLNMPVKSGFECLDEIRKHTLLQQIFVIIYSTSTSPADIDMVKSKGANLFINKPNSFTELKTILKGVFAIDLKTHKPSEQFMYTARMAV